MMALYIALDTKEAKTHVTYRYMINPEHSFIRLKDEMLERADVERIMHANRT